MKTINNFQLLEVSTLDLDKDNPRIKSILEMYDEIDEEKIKLALISGSGSAETAGTTYTSLKESIRSNGGIINPIIVSYKTLTSEYVVVEGNTRVQIYKEFQKDNIKGSWDLIPAVVYTDLDKEEIDSIRLQAHLVGPREWDPYSKAKYLFSLYHEDNLPMAQIVDFCGGKKGDVVDYIQAYKIMEEFYRPLLNSDDEFEKNKFSAFREVLKITVREAIERNGFNLTDFSSWVIDDKFKPIADIRQLPIVLNNEKGKEIFLKQGKTLKDALKATITPFDINNIEKATLEFLLNEAIKRVKQLPFEEFKSIKNGTDQSRFILIFDAYERLGELVQELNGREDV